MPRTHASLPRLLVDSPLQQAAQITLGRDQSNYLGAVLRRRVGDDVVLFNGRNGAWRCRVAEADRRAVVLVAQEQVAAQTAPSDLWYGFAPLKAARLEYVVQKATEMGAGIIQPVLTRFTQAHRLNPDKLTAYAREAAEQCEVLTLPRIGPQIDLGALLDGWTAGHGERALVLADEGAASGSPLTSLERLRGRAVGLLVGPEGGFAPEERERLLALPFVVPISLGPRILRADTAAVAALAVLQASIGDWR